MTYESFCNLHDQLKDGIANAIRSKRQPNSATNHQAPLPRSGARPPISNGSAIETSVRLGCALRYFAGGQTYDIQVKYGISHTEVIDSVWFVVEAINKHEAFFIQYPSDQDEQYRMAAAWKAVSGVDFACCAGAIDGLLIWIHQPTESDAAKAGVGKFGVNCQAVCDVRGRIVDISMIYGGSSSDCIAFEASQLWSSLEDGLLALGLVLYGDNAYLNTSYLWNHSNGRLPLCTPNS